MPADKACSPGDGDRSPSISGTEPADFVGGELHPGGHPMKSAGLRPEPAEEEHKKRRPSPKYRPSAGTPCENPEEGLDIRVRAHIAIAVEVRVAAGVAAVSGDAAKEGL